MNSPLLKAPIQIWFPLSKEKGEREEEKKEEGEREEGGREQGSGNDQRGCIPYMSKGPWVPASTPSSSSGLVFWTESALSVDGHISPARKLESLPEYSSVVSQLGISLLHLAVQQARFRSQAEMSTPFLETDRLDRVIAVWSNREWEVIWVLQAFWWGTIALCSPESIPSISGDYSGQNSLYSPWVHPHQAILPTPLYSSKWLLKRL